MKILIFGLILIGGDISMAYLSSKQQGECSTPNDCGPDECCVVGMIRYSIPQCLPLRALGQHCRVESEPVTKFLYYPNLQMKYVEGAYDLFCPCAPTLTCLDGQCQKDKTLAQSEGNTGRKVEDSAEANYYRPVSSDQANVEYNPEYWQNY